MSDRLIREVTPTAAALVCAVSDRDELEVARVLTQLDTEHLHALAIVLADHIDPDKPFTPHVAPHSDPVGAALRAAALRFHVTVADLVGRSRRRDIAAARSVACYAAHRLDVTYSDIGRHLGRDHTTVMHAVGRVGSDRHLRTVADGIIAELHPPQEQIAS